MLRLLLLLASILPLCAQTSGKAHIPLPADLSGIHNGSEYRILVPANWNGTLLVYAHAGLTTALEVVPQTYPQASPALEEQLQSAGYALAASFYPDSEKEAPRQTRALTNFFNGQVGKPLRTIVWGASTGGTVALQMAEDHPAPYDGAIAVAPVGAGGARDADSSLRYGLAYAAVFGWPDEWWGTIEDLRDDLWGNEATLIMPVFQWASNENYAQWEFVRLVMQLPYGAWWDYDESIGLWGYAIDGWKATAYRSYLEKVCGGRVAQNIGDVYTLTDEEKQYLAGLGLDADQLLAWMNTKTYIAARRSARNIAELQYGTPSGKLRRPVITMHGMYDPIVPVSHEAAYRVLVDAANSADLLVQTYVNQPGHIAFSAEQYLATLRAMESWLDTGVRPDASFFPESLHFDHSFVPPPWPY